MKITFNDEASLNQVINDSNMKQEGYSFLVEKFRSQPKEIKCNRCQGFGHVYRLCRSNKPKCGKCSKDLHRTKDCTNTDKTVYCAHCQSTSHVTGNKIGRNTEKIQLCVQLKQ